MGIKNIHMALILASIFVIDLFGVWALNHEMKFLGIISIVLSGGLIIYFIDFVKKAKTL